MDHQTFAQLLGNYGEFVGAIAVVATLAYLAVQIRQNTLSNRAAAYQSWVENSNTTNVFAREIFPFRERAYYETDSLTSEEKAKLDFYFVGVMNTLEAAYFMQLQQTIDSEYWKAKLRTLQMAMAWPGFRLCWDEYRQMYDTRFATVVEETIKRIEEEQ